MVDRLQGKVCIITGTGGSMGAAAAKLFAREGALVVGTDINEASAKETLEAVRAEGGQMTSYQPCDLTDAKQCQSLVEFALETHGRVDVLYNNAAHALFNWIEDISDDEWSTTLAHEVNLVFLLTRAAWPHLKKSSGVVVNTASVTAWTTFKTLGALAHTTAKAGIVALTRQLAMEGREFGIRANSISPGLIETKQSARELADPEWAKFMLGRTMLNRLGKPEEVANVALFLASDESSYVTGSDFAVDGGMRAW